MNTAITNNGIVINPFGHVTTSGQPPTGSASTPWMMSTVDQQQINVAGAPWRNSAPKTPPLGNKRAVFRFDGSGELVIVEAP